MRKLRPLTMMPWKSPSRLTRDARTAADDAYHEAQRRADALKAQSAHLYDEAIKRGRAYGDRAARFTGDNKALALLFAGRCRLSGGLGLQTALTERSRSGASLALRLPGACCSCAP